MLIEKLKENLAINYDLWEIAHESETSTELHFVLARRYDPSIKRFLKREATPENIACWVGFHCHNLSLVNAKYHLTVNSVMKLENNNNMLANDQFISTYRQPLNFTCNDEFQLSHNDLEIRDNSNNIISQKYLDLVYKIHVRPLLLLKGFPLRTKFRIVRVLGVGLFSSISWTGRIILGTLYGEKYSEKNTEDIYYQILIKKKAEIIRESSDKTINFMGNTINAYSAATYSFIHLILAILYIFFGMHIEIVAKLKNNAFLVLAYAIVSLYIYEKTIPDFLHKLIEETAKIAIRNKSKNLKV